MPRNYKSEYDNYQGKPEQIARRSARNQARRKAISSGKAKKGDGKDIHHKNGNPLDNRSSNLAKTTKRANRSFPRTKTARKK